jgi:hypothetical protein
MYTCHQAALERKLEHRINAGLDIETVNTHDLLEGRDQKMERGYETINLFDSAVH